MFIVFIEDDADSVGRIHALLRDAVGLEAAIFPTPHAARRVLQRTDTMIVFVSMERDEGLGLKKDFATLRKMTTAPIGVLADSLDESEMSSALAGGADVLIERKDLSLPILRHAVRHLRAHRAASKLRQVQLGLQSLIAPLEYLEFGLTTLVDGQEGAEQSATRVFIEHLLETIQSLKSCAQARQGEISSESVGRLVEHSRSRMSALARSRGVSLRADWETASFESGAPTQLAELGLQHLLEGVLRCCGDGDGVWLHGEKGADTSVIRIHLSRRVLPSADVLFPGAAAGPGMGLDASSSIQLGALLLSLTREKVELVSEHRQQMLSLFL